MATRAGSGGAVRTKPGWRPHQGGPWPSRHRPRTTNCEGLAPRTAEARIKRHLDSDGAQPAEAASRFEPLDVPPLLPFWLGALIAFFIVVVLVGITIGYPLADRQQYRGPLKTLPPAPRLESAPMAELQRYHAAKQRELRTIDSAMQATAKQGWGPPK